MFKQICVAIGYEVMYQRFLIDDDSAVDSVDMRTQFCYFIMRQEAKRVLRCLWSCLGN